MRLESSLESVYTGTELSGLRADSEDAAAARGGRSGLGAGKYCLYRDAFSCAYWAHHGVREALCTTIGMHEKSGFGPLESFFDRTCAHGDTIASTAEMPLRLARGCLRRSHQDTLTQ